MLRFVVDDAPYFEDSIFASCGQIIATGAKLYGPDWLLMSSDILYQKHVTFDAFLSFVDPGIYPLMQKEYIFLILHLHYKWILVANFLFFLIKLLFHHSLQPVLVVELHKSSKPV